MGLGLLKGVHTIEEAREKAKLLLSILKGSCLLEDNNESHVKLHDIMSDAALSIASKTYPSLVIRNSNLLTTYFGDDLRACKSITLYLGDKMHELPERLVCPILDMLLIYTKEQQSTYLEIPDSFFKDLRELKVLDISDLIITSLPSSIQFLSKLHTLCLDRVTIEIEDLATIGKLKTLRSLTFRGSAISRISKEIGELNNLRLLDLTDCNHLQVIEPNVLGNLIHLEELHLPTNFDKWDIEGTSNASLTELNNMSCLSNLDICIPNAASLPNNMPFQQLVRYKIYIGDMWYRVDFREARTLKLELDSSSSKMILKELLQTTLKKTEDFFLHGWVGFEESITELSKEGFPELKHMRVERCPSVQYIFHSKHSNAVPVLESLFLCYLTNLQKICEGDLPDNYLSNLKVIKIEACGELRNLFSSSMAKNLLNLEEITVSDCTMIQEIVTYSEMDDIDEGGGIAADKMELKRLRMLRLTNLPKISSLCTRGKWKTVKDVDSSQFEFLDGRQVLFPSLDFLTLCELPMLTKISHGQYPVQLHLLKSLELCKCESLLYAVDSNLLLQLKNLESIIIDSCESMETIFNLENLDDACGSILNQPLQIKLRLSNLPKLKTIWNKNLLKISEVLKLQKLEVSNCEKLKNLFSPALAKSLESMSQMSIASCMAMEEIITLGDEENDQDLEDGMVFPSLTHLSISDMENLTTFSHGNHCYQFPSLTYLMISSCPEMGTFVSMKQGKVAIGDASFFNTKVDLPSLEKLVLHSLKSIENIWDDNLSKDSFYKLAFLEIKECARVRSIFHSHLLERLQNLTKFEVESCDLLEVLFGHVPRKLMLNRLQEVRLLRLRKLRYVVMKSHPSEEATLSFPSLRDIFVEECGNLIYLFPNAMARSLSKLANMYISSCEVLEEVVTFDGEEGTVESTEAMRFKNLTSLHLENLDSLVHFCSGHYELYFPFLRKLLIIECKELKAFVLRLSNSVRPEKQSQEISMTSDVELDFSPLFDEKVIFPNLQELLIRGLALKEIWPKNEPANFEMDLKVFVVEDCHQLSTIVPSLMLPKLRSLESLYVKSCNSLEVIFELEKHSPRGQKISRSKSTTKILENLHELTVSLCKSMQHIVAMRDKDHNEDTLNRTVTFPQLSSLTLTQLPRLDSFCHKNQEIELPSLMELEIDNCEAVEVLVADSNQDCTPLLSVEKVEFPRMVSIVISNMQNLRKLWHISKEGAHPECSSEAFRELKRLDIIKCDSLLTVFPSKMIRTFQNLEELIVNDCESLESVFESTATTGLRSGTGTGFDRILQTFALRKLNLWDLPRMKHVWDVQDPRWFDLSFENVYSISVFGCHCLRYLIPLSVARSLRQLYALEVGDCKGMDQIVLFALAEYLQFLEWPTLEHLRIEKCPNSRILSLSMYSLIQKVQVKVPRLKWMDTDVSTLENRQFLDEMNANPTSLVLRNINNQAWVKNIPWSLLVEGFPNLQTLEIWDSDFKEIFPSDNNNNEKEGCTVTMKSRILDIAGHLVIHRCHHLTNLPPSSTLFRNLTILVVWRCNGLQYLVTPFVARGLEQLTELDISGCKKLEEIVAYDRDENGNRPKDDGDDDADISFPNLKNLRLYKLRCLRSFSSTSCNFNFPSLRNVDMQKLPEMHVFCEGGFTTPYKHRITRDVRGLYKKELKRWWIQPGC